MVRVDRLLMIWLTLAASAAWAQPPQIRPSEVKKADPPNTVTVTGTKATGGELKRIVYIVRHAPAATLATVLGEHFKDDVNVEVRAVAEQVSNTLLISASPAVFDDVLKILAQLDRAPRMISLEVLVVELELSRAPAGADPAAVRRATPPRGDLFAGLTGPAADELAKARRLEPGSELDVVQRIRLSTLENQNAFVQLGERKPVVQGVTQARTGTAKVTRDVNVGLLVGIVPRVGPDGSVVAQFDFEKSQVAPRPDDIVIGAGDAGEPIQQASIVTSVFKSTVQIARNQAVLVSNVQTTGTRQSQMLLIVTATVDAPEAAR